MMKKLLFLLILSITFIKAELLKVDESKVDIYFGNGVKNTKKEASAGKDALEEIIQLYIIGEDSILQRKYGKLKLSYNWGLGDVNDLLETFYQLKEAGQMSYYDIYDILSRATYSGLVGLALSPSVIAGLMARMPDIGETEQKNIDKMLPKYYEESFKWSHCVLLVSHFLVTTDTAATRKNIFNVNHKKNKINK